MPDTRPIPPADLLIDAENPRLVQPNSGQRDAQREIARHQGKKLLALAEDIVAHGLNPSALPIVVPLNDDLKRYTVSVTPSTCRGSLTVTRSLLGRLAACLYANSRSILIA